MQATRRSYPRSIGVAAILLGFLLSACTVQPLYGPTASGTELNSELAAISVLPADDRLSQIARNELMFAFNGGRDPAFPVYVLSVTASSEGSGLNITAPGNIASSIVRVTLRYTLLDAATGDVIDNGAVTAETRYQRSNQAFANLRSREDAEERAAIAAAEMARLRIASAIAVL